MSQKGNIAFKYRIYPNAEQRIMLAKTFGCCRKIYNLMLNDKITYYREHKEPLYVTPARYKEEYPYLKEVDSLALANEQMNLNAAFSNFFKNRKFGFPKFKCKKRDKNSYTTNNVNNNISVSERSVKLPKVGEVKAVIHRPAPEGYVLKSMTVSQEKDGTYYVSVLYYSEEKDEPAKAVETHVGLDYKSDGLYVASDGTKADMPHYYRESEKRLAKEQRRLSRMTKGSKNYEKQKKQIAKLSRHIANQRKDFLQKKSAEITNQYDLISVEDLDMKAMAQALKLGKSTLDNGYGMFVEMLRYKQTKKGHHFVKVDKFYPSSQLCQCGYKNKDAKDLKLRLITCPKCKRTYDRDENAAINIDKEGFRIHIETASA